MKVRKEQCATCPFREGSKYAHLASTLAESALSKASRVCHSTGSNNAINRATGLPPMICRGARDLQLKMFVALGLLSEPTDRAWSRQCKIMGIKQV